MMKKFLIITSLFASLGLLFAFTNSSENEETLPTEASSVTWMTFEEAVEASKTKPKKMMIDLYTDWCGWCKKMDKTTFEDPKVVKYLNDNFYAVKFDAEQKSEINFNGHQFKWVAGGRNGIHTLAYSLLDGNLSYPTVVYLNEKFERIMISPGFKEAPDMIKELKFAAEEHYRNTTWRDYQRKN
jgi:thioredoxin-related protein